LKSSDLARPKPSEEEVDAALAAIIANTRRLRRSLNLLEIAKNITVALGRVGSLQKLSYRVGLSEQMLREFLAVEDLVPKVRGLVARREIDGIDIASRIARLPAKDQVPTAEAAVARRLDGADVRAVVALRKVLPRTSIAKVIDRVRKSRDIREYLAEFIVPPDAPSTAGIETCFAELVGKENIRRFDVAGPVGVLAMNPEGRRRLQQIARRRGLTTRRLVDMLVAKGATRRAQSPNK